ncbi:hypothetical protein diail_7648 [Diaporthe ilicicola]|nr:hypothetical protein diail_7648 [Diaporthe ilicicola]
MHFQAALSAAVFSASAFADALPPRQNSCVMCTEAMPTCPVCPANQECFISDPTDCTQCPRAYCADNAADATPTPTPTGILGGSTGSTSSTSDGGFSLPTVSESGTSTASGSTTASSGAPSTGASGVSGSASATASAPAASASAPSSASAKNADLSGMLGFAFLMTVPVLALQRLW